MDALGTTVTVRVVDGDGNPAEGKLELRDAPAGTSVSAYGDGIRAVGLLPPGTFTLLAMYRERETTRSVTVDGEGQLEIEIVVE